MKWEEVCKPKSLGGLGVGNLVVRNRALLGKWLWRFPLEIELLWHSIIRSKYGIQINGWDANEGRGVSYRNPWKFISQSLLFSFKTSSWD